VVQSASIFGVLAAEPAGSEPVGANEAEHPTTEAETHQPDNPVLPVGGELLWSAGCFILLWALLKFWLLKPIVKTMEERSAKIRGDIQAAESARSEASTALTEYERTLAGARTEASGIIDEARTQADEERKRLMAAAEAEVSELRAAANAEVTRAKSVALVSLRDQVADIAVQAAEAVVQKRLDAGAQRAIVEEYLNRASQN
jgi:F-type H+-transporting ATPase subunit b